ncbi:hypothetical protein HY772_07780 [Candidatus Woesearchaeota archaeon]|nr:hypothetical protein [Candidatus Woesearchaeota archaeon]
MSWIPRRKKHLADARCGGKQFLDLAQLLLCLCYPVAAFNLVDVAEVSFHRKNVDLCDTPVAFREERDMRLKKIISRLNRRTQFLDVFVVLDHRDSPKAMFQAYVTVVVNKNNE